MQPGERELERGSYRPSTTSRTGESGEPAVRESFSRHQSERKGVPRVRRVPSALHQYFLRKRKDSPNLTFEKGPNEGSPLPGAESEPPYSTPVLSSFAVDKNYRSNSSFAARQLLRDPKLWTLRRKESNEGCTSRVSCSDEDSIRSSGSTSESTEAPTEVSDSSDTSLPCFRIGDADCEGDMLYLLKKEQSADDVPRAISCCVDNDTSTPERPRRAEFFSFVRDGLDGEFLRKPSMEWRGGNCKGETSSSDSEVLSPSVERSSMPLKSAFKLSASVNELEALQLTGDSALCKSPSGDSGGKGRCCESCGYCLSQNQKQDYVYEKPDFLLTIEKGHVKLVSLKRPKPPVRSTSLPDLHLGVDLEEDEDPSKTKFSGAPDESTGATSVGEDNLDVSRPTSTLSFIPKFSSRTLDSAGRKEMEERRPRSPPTPRDRTTFISRKNPNRFSVVLSKAQQWRRKVQRARRRGVVQGAPAAEVPSVPPPEHSVASPWLRLHEGGGSSNALVASNLFSSGSAVGLPDDLYGRLSTREGARSVAPGNHYGTPKPPAQGGEVGRGNPSLLSGAHPSSEGKRRRNRSNVEAMAANTIDSPPPPQQQQQAEPFGGPIPYQPPSERGRDAAPPSGELGPLPPNWEKAFTDNGEPYFIDHVAGTSSWLDPRLARVQKRNAEECGEDELPFGWERIDDPQYGTYYIDHVNRKTQYENPVLMAKRQLDEPSQASIDEPNPSTFPRPKKPLENEGSSQKLAENGHMYHASKRSYSRSGSAFTRNPTELKGEFLRTTLMKSSRGLGFTIVGGDDNEEEFLQIKSVVPNGPAWQDGKLRTGDVLVYVNDTCVLGYTHADVVNMFQNIEPGRTVYLEVCRGYPLPFDPNDPNTEIVTTVAVTSADSRSSKSAFGEDFEGHRSRNNSSESMNTAKSMPDLSNTERVQQVPRPGSADLLNSENLDHSPQVLEFYSSNLSKPEYLTIPIVKGSMGFGFTIADSAYGQKVKKILDRARCKNLGEGDILVDINSVNVKGMTHTEVVQVLKDCTQGHEAIIMVQRGGLNSPSKSRAAGGRKDPVPSPKKSPSAAPTGGGLYRSKTPTADMYSSQPKEVIPNRPKTPLVDTRNRPKTPNSYPSSREEVEIDVGQEGRSYPSASSYPAAFSYVGSNSMDSCGDHKVSNLSTQMGHATLNGSSFEQGTNDKYFASEQDPGHGNYNYHRELCNQNGYPVPTSIYHYGKDGYINPPPKPPEPYPQYSSYYSSNNPSIYNHTNNSHLPQIDQNNSYGYMPYPKEGFDIPRQDSGYSSQAQVPPSRNPYPPYYGHNSSVGYSAPSDGYFVQNEGSSRRKESTSFELEHPAPVPMSSPADRFSSLNSGGLSRHHASSGTPNMDPSSATYHDFTVTLRRQENGFGFRIVGGTEEGSQVSIGHIVPGGAADQDGTVMSGDEIVCVDGEVVIGSSHHRVVQLMAAAANQGRVSLTLRRPIHGLPPSSSSDVHNRSMEVQYPYDVIVSRMENEGFGFVIISSVAKSGSTIGRIIEGSPAERCGKLHIGDRILRVNGIDIKSLHHGSIVNLIKESGYSVTLTIGPPRDDASSTTSNSQRAESEAGDEGELHHVELHRSSRGFGFSIRGGKEFHNMPLFVLRIAENGPAAEDGKLKVGDQLMEINNVVTKNMTHAEAIELIKQCGSTVSLLVRRGVKLPPHLDPLSPVSPNNLGSPVGPPPPGTHIRSTATLPSGSPSNPNYPSNSVPMGHYGYSAPPNVPSSYPSNYTHPGSGRGPPQPMHSSPASQYPLPLNSHASNGPLGQSSPRVSAPTDSYYWNRVPEHRPG